MGWEIKEELDHEVDLVVEAGETPAAADHGRGLVGGCARGRSGAAPATRTASRPDASAISSALRALGGAIAEAGQAERVADEQGDAVVGQPGEHGLDDAVAGVARSSPGRVRPTSVKTPSMISGGSTPTVKKSRGPHPQRDADAERDEAQVEEEADPARRAAGRATTAVSASGDAERDDLAAGLAALFPERARVAHGLVAARCRRCGSHRHGSVGAGVAVGRARAAATARQLAAVPSERAVALDLARGRAARRR